MEEKVEFEWGVRVSLAGGRDGLAHAGNAPVATPPKLAHTADLGPGPAAPASGRAFPAGAPVPRRALGARRSLRPRKRRE